MSQVAIITDSTADFPQGIKEKLGIRVVPLYVRFGAEEYIDGVTITNDEFYAKLKKSEVLPQTTQPSPEDFLQAYQTANTDKILSILISSKLSGTINSAMRYILKDFDIRIIDSTFLTLSLGFLVMRAAEMAQAGEKIDVIEAEIKRLIPKVRLYGALDTLHYLEKGGRIGAVQAWVGSLLQVKPIITIKDGEVKGVERARSRGKAISRLVEFIQAEGEMARLGVIHAAAADEAQVLANVLKEKYPNLDVPVVQTGSVIGTHSGPGLIGICGLSK